MKKHSDILVIGAIIVAIVAIVISKNRREQKRDIILEETRRISDSMRIVQQIRDSMYEEQQRKNDSITLTNLKNRMENTNTQTESQMNSKSESPLILGLFNVKMTSAEYKERRQYLINNGELKLWDETNYYVYLFSVDETVYNPYIGKRYSTPNSFHVELRYAPIFNNGKFTSWELPVWPALSDSDSNNLQHMINYFTKLYGASSQHNGSTYSWKKGNLKIELSMKNVDPDLTDGLNYKERVPVLTYRAV